MSIRQDILNTAGSLISGDRAEQYGDPTVMFGQIADNWAAYEGVPVSEVDAAMKMALMKIARIQMGKVDIDSFIDACGYIALAGEMAIEGAAVSGMVAHQHNATTGSSNG